MAAGADGGGWSCSSGGGGGVFVEEFSERELEVAAILAGLKSALRVRLCVERRPVIPSWGKRRRRTKRTSMAAEKSARIAAAADGRGEGATSPDTPLAFPQERADGDEDEAAVEEKAKVHREWVQEQRGVVASLSEENARLLKQIEEFRVRLQSSRSTNDSLKKIQNKQLKRPLPPPNEEAEEEERKRGTVHAGAGWPALGLGLDLNEPVLEAEAVAAAAQWPRHREQHKAALTAAARRRRQLIRRAKAAASRTRQLG